MRYTRVTEGPMDRYEAAAELLTLAIAMVAVVSTLL